MSVLQRSQQLRELTAADREAERGHHAAEAFRNRRVDLAGLRERLVNDRACLAVLVKHGAQVTRLPDSSSTRRALERYSLRLAEDPDSSGGDHGALKRSLDSYVGKIEDLVDDLRKRVEQESVHFNETFLRQVELIPRYKGLVAKIRSERNNLLGGVRLAEMSAVQLDEFLTRRDRIGELVSEVSGEEFPNAVLAFFKAARERNGAPIAKLTEEVREWLERNELTKNIRVIVVDAL
jgi:hypothetical protein